MAESEANTEQITPEQQAARAEELTREVQRRFQARMIEKGNTGPCVMCGANAWLIGSYVTLAATPNPGQISIGGPSYPFVIIFCSNCGNTHFINLLTLGFTQSDWPDLTYPSPTKPSV